MTINGVMAVIFRYSTHMVCENDVAQRI